MNYSKFLTALLTPEKVEGLYGYLLCKVPFWYLRDSLVRGKFGVYSHSNPERSDGEQSLNTHPCRARKGVDRVIKVTRFEGRAIFMLSIGQWGSNNFVPLLSQRLPS